MRSLSAPMWDLQTAGDQLSTLSPTIGYQALPTFCRFRMETCLSLCLDDPFRDRSATRDVDDETGDERVETEAPVEPVGESGHVVAGVLAVLQRMKHTSQSCLQVAKHRVDPIGLGQITELEIAHDDWQVNASTLGHHPEAAKSITGHHLA